MSNDACNRLYSVLEPESASLGRRLKVGAGGCCELPDARYRVYGRHAFCTRALQINNITRVATVRLTNRPTAHVVCTRLILYVCACVRDDDKRTSRRSYIVWFIRNKNRARFHRPPFEASGAQPPTTAKTKGTNSAREPRESETICPPVVVCQKHLHKNRWTICMFRPQRLLCPRSRTRENEIYTHVRVHGTQKYYCI